MLIAISIATQPVFAHFQISIDPPLIQLLKKLEKYSNSLPIEKVHIHLDKPYYSSGENIWFKAYVTNTQSGTTSNLSKLLYVDLLDAQGELFKQNRVALINGLGWADFALPDTLAEGNYRIRAYTKWMENEPKNYFFEKVIKIGNTWENSLNIETAFEWNQQPTGDHLQANLKMIQKNGSPFNLQKFQYEILNGEESVFKNSASTDSEGKVSLIIKDINFNAETIQTIKITTIINNKKTFKLIPIIFDSRKIDLQFFPESGEMINGISSRIAFKALNSIGKGIPVSGVINNKEGQVVAEFKSNELGMGSFYLLPQEGQNYTATINSLNVDSKYSLPQSKASGYILSVNNDGDDKISAKIAFSNDLISSDSLSLILHQHGLPFYSSQIATQKNTSVLNLPKTNLPSGVYTLTLLNSQEIPLAERVLFLNQENDKIKIETKNLDNSFKTRENMILHFNGFNADSSVRSNYSVSVTHTSSVVPDEENETHIYTSLLLKGDLKGYIENPNRYFIKNDLDTKKDLDHLMLTQGWRKLNWEHIKNEKFPTSPIQSQALLPITGKVTNSFGSPRANIKVTILNPLLGFNPEETITNEQGRFSFNNYIYLDTVSFFAHAIRKNNSNDLIISIDEINVKDFPSKSILNEYSLNINKDLEAYLRANDKYFAELKRQGNLNGVINLKEVEIKGEKTVRDESFYKSFHGIRKPDIVIEAKDFGFTMDLITLISTRYNPSGAITSSLSNTPGGLLMVVDGMISEFAPNIQDIALIEIIKPISSFTSLYGSRGGNGVLLITTKSKSDIPVKNTNFIYFNPPGISVSREFYSPKYTANSVKTNLDLRKTVYWNPNILSEKNGDFSFNYFNTDEPGTYRMVIEGISETGHLARKVYTYEVK